MKFFKAQSPLQQQNNLKVYLLYPQTVSWRLSEIVNNFGGCEEFLKWRLFIVRLDLLTVALKTSMSSSWIASQLVSSSSTRCEFTKYQTLALHSINKKSHLRRFLELHHSVDHRLLYGGHLCTTGNLGTHLWFTNSLIGFRDVE